MQAVEDGVAAHIRPRGKAWSILPLVERCWRFYAPVFLFGWLIYLMIANTPNFHSNVFQQTLILHAAFAGLAAVYIAFLALRRRLPGPTPLDWAATALILAYVLAVAASDNARVSLETALFIGAVLFAYYAVHDFQFIELPSLSRGLVCVGIVFAFIVLLVSLSQYLVWVLTTDAVGSFSLDKLIPPRMPRSVGQASHPNNLAMVLNFAVPFVLVAIVMPARRWDRVIGVLALVFILPALFFTGSRGAWMTLSVVLPFFFLLYSLRNRELTRCGLLRLLPRRAVVLSLAMPFTLAAASAVLILATDIRPPWLFRDSLTPRLEAVSVGLNMVKDRPLLGSGPDSFFNLFGRYGGDNLSTSYPHPNVYLSVLIELGILGSLAILGGALLIVVALIRAFVRASADNRVWLASCAAALSTQAVHGLVDGPYNLPVVLLPFAVILAMAMRLSEGATLRRENSPSRIPGALVLLLIPVVLGGWLILDSPHSHYNESLQGLAKADYERAAKQAAKAADSDPHLAGYQIHAGVTHALLYLARPGSDPAHSSLDNAIAYLQRGVELDSGSAIGYANLALALRLNNDPDAAMEAARIALNTGGPDPKIALVAGTIFEWAGSTTEAVEAYARVIGEEPILSQSSFWSLTPERSTMLPAIIASSGVGPCALGRYAVLYGDGEDELSGYVDACRARVAASTNDAESRLDLALLLYALGHPQDASQEAEEALRRRPKSPGSLMVHAIVMSDEWALSRVRHELVLSTYLGSQDAKLLLARTYREGEGSGASLNLRLVSGTDEMPSVIGRWIETADPTRFRQGHYPRGFLYYRRAFKREEPARILIPGEWESMFSPRSVLVSELLRK